MATTISNKHTLDINFTIGTAGNSYIWKFNEPEANITTLAQIRNAFGFDNDGNPSTDTGLFGSLYQDGLRLYAKNEEIKTISSAQKVTTTITKEDML